MDLNEEEELFDTKLPERLFHRDGMPLNGTSHVYSKMDYLSTIAKYFEDKPELETIRESCFGKLFELPVSRCANSCKLIQNLICRQVVTKRRHEMWIVFGGKPLKFSLREFALTTGLPCGQFPDATTLHRFKNNEPDNPTYWDELLGENRELNVEDLVSMLHSQKSNDEKLRISFLIIVSGVLVVKTQVAKINPVYVEWLRDLDFFLSYPWGRETFNVTMSRMTVSAKDESRRKVSWDGLRHSLGQKTITILGFPQALQLLALDSIPNLLAKLKNSDDRRTFYQVTYVAVNKNVSLLSKTQIRQAESETNVEVVPVLADIVGLDIGDCSWEDEMVDVNIEYLENLVLEQHKFYPSQWPEPELPPMKTNGQQVQYGATTSTSETGRVCDHVLLGFKEKELEGKVTKLIDDHKTWVINQKKSELLKTADLEDRVKEMLKEHQEWVMGQIGGLKKYFEDNYQPLNNRSDPMSSTWKDYSGVDVVINDLNENNVNEGEDNVVKDNALFPSPMDQSKRVIEETNEPLAQAVRELPTTEPEFGVDKEVNENSQHDGGNGQGEKAIVEKGRGKRKRTRSEKLQYPFTPGSRLRPLFAAPKKVIPYHPLTQPDIGDFEAFKNALEQEGEDESYQIVTGHAVDNRTDMAKITEEDNEMFRIKYAMDVYAEFVGTHDKLLDNADAVKYKRKGKVANEDGEASKVMDDDNAVLGDVLRSLKHVREHVKKRNLNK